MNLNLICKEFRINILKITLSELSNVSGINLKTISAFENGRSNNCEHITAYLNVATDNQREQFYTLISQNIGGNNV